MSVVIITVLCGIAIGLALGLTGGGGSNFAVPLLIYAVGLAPVDAMPVSLAAVGIVAALGAIHVVRAKLVAWPPTLTFACGGMVGAPVGLRLAHGLSEQVLTVGFALLALAVGSAMWRRASRYPEEASVVRALPEGHSHGPVCRLAEDGQLRFTAPCSVVLALTGVGAGLLSGLFGVGGGFVIVPALMTITRMGIHAAVATSLLVITMTGFAGAGYAAWEGRIAWAVLLPFACGGAIGMVLGRRLAGRIAGPRLQQLFAGAVILIALLMLITRLR